MAYEITGSHSCRQGACDCFITPSVRFVRRPYQIQGTVVEISLFVRSFAAVLQFQKTDMPCRIRTKGLDEIGVALTMMKRPMTVRLPCIWRQAFSGIRQSSQRSLTGEPISRRGPT